MATINLTEAKFNETVENNDIVILDFWASWCGPCRAFAPIFEKVSEQHPDIVFAKVNTEVEQGLAQYFSVRAIPTLMVIRDGVVLLNEPGMLPEAALQELVAEVREVDMDEVRRQLDEGEEDYDLDDSDAEDA